MLQQPSFQSLQGEANQPGSIWSEKNITWEVGATYNVNKNPISENKICELEKEILRFKALGGPLTPLDLVLVTEILNSRVRQHGKSAKELMAKDNKPIDVSDKEIASAASFLPHLR